MQSAGAHSEVERKFEGDVREGWLADLPTGREQRHALSALYIDSPSYDLAARGWTLRRRTGGHDAGWHLKRPVSADERVEVHWPLGEHLPAALRFEVAEVIGDAPLVGIARLDTDRREIDLLADGAPAGVLCVDAVTATVPGGADAWHEVEVELLPGADRRLLDEWSAALLASGLRSAGHGAKVERALAALRPPTDDVVASDVVLAYLRKQADVFADLQQAVRTDEPDAVHKTRVATRRLRSALRVFDDLFDSDAARALASELRWAAELLGGPRDAEVMREHLASRLDALDPSADVDAARLHIEATLAADHVRVHDALLAAMDEPRWARLRRDLAAFVADPPLLEPDPAGPTGRALLLRHVWDALAHADRRHDKARRRPQVAERWHDLRKSAKAVRYAIDAVRDSFGEQAATSSQEWADVTEAFGELQDGEVARETLARLEAEGLERGLPPGPYEALILAEATDHDRVLADGVRAFERARSPESLAWTVSPAGPRRRADG